MGNYPLRFSVGELARCVVHEDTRFLNAEGEIIAAGPFERGDIAWTCPDCGGQAIVDQPFHYLFKISGNSHDDMLAAGVHDWQLRKIDGPPDPAPAKRVTVEEADDVCA